VCSSDLINSSANAILRYSSIINQVYLPKFLFPLSFTITQLVNFMFGLVIVAIFLAFNGVVPTWHVVYLPIIIIITLAFLLAVGSVLGFFTVFIREDRKSTRLNSSHVSISYGVFCLIKK